MKRFLPRWLVIPGLAASVLVPTVAGASPAWGENRYSRHEVVDGRHFYRGDGYAPARRDDWDRGRLWRAHQGFPGSPSRGLSFSFSVGGWNRDGRR